MAWHEFYGPANAETVSVARPLAGQLKGFVVAAKP
jgi:hypothetical protein